MYSLKQHMYAGMPLRKTSFTVFEAAFEFLTYKNLKTPNDACLLCTLCCKVGTPASNS